MDHPGEREDKTYSSRRSRSPTRRDPHEPRARSPRHQRHRSHSRHRSRSRSRDRTNRKARQKDDVHQRSRSRSPDRHNKYHRRQHSSSPSPHRRHRSRSREKRRRSQSRSGSPSSSDSDEDRRSRKKKHRKHHRSRSRSKDRDRKAKKKEKKEKKKKKSAAVSAQWGKYGLINESDMYTKEAEFRAWLVEERMLNPESMSKDQTRKEFAKFVEDFNTATLSHEKFYHMEAYERRMSALRAGEFVPPADDGYDPSADMRAHQSKHKRQVVEQESYLSKEQLQELRRVQQERVEAGKMKLLGMDVKQNMGIRMDGTMFDG